MEITGFFVYFCISFYISYQYLKLTILGAANLNTVIVKDHPRKIICRFLQHCKPSVMSNNLF